MAVDAKRQRRVTVSAEDLSELDARLIVSIYKCCRETGSGPRWKPIAQATGWKKHGQLRNELWRLRRAGLVTWTDFEEGSLRTFPDAVLLAAVRLKKGTG